MKLYKLKDADAAKKIYSCGKTKSGKQDDIIKKCQQNVKKNPLDTDS